jgi:hypothetical protein
MEAIQKVQIPLSEVLSSWFESANMLSNYECECMFRKAGIAEANSAFNLCSDDRHPAAAPMLATCSPTFSIGKKMPLRTPRDGVDPCSR